jgi:hypothetical protein
MKITLRLGEAVQVCDRVKNALKIMEEVIHHILMFCILQTNLQ